MEASQDRGYANALTVNSDSELATIDCRRKRDSIELSLHSNFLSLVWMSSNLFISVYVQHC
jgi:hypothetical protein